MTLSECLVSAFTGMLVLVGTGQVLVYWRQHVFSKKFERAWVVFELRRVTGLSDRERWRLDPPQSVNVTFTFAFVNGGKTVTRMKSGTILGACVDPATLPNEPSYGNLDEDWMPDVLLIPNGSQEMQVNHAFRGEHLLRWLNGDGVLVLFGFVTYGDIAGKLRETRFCMTCRSSEDWPDGGVGFHFGGPPAYNRVT